MRTAYCVIRKLMNHATSLKKWLLVFIGSLAVGLGFLGVFLPLLPTTPFLLLAAACYVRSSERFYHWLIHHKWFGEYIRNYQAGHGIPLRAKIFSISLLWLTIGFSAFVVMSNLHIRLFLLLIAIGVTWHLLAVKTLREDEKSLLRFEEIAKE